MAHGDQPIIVKKVVHGGHAHHGGSWKVAYADFVTAMMAFFMVMWIMGLSDETKAQIQGYFNDPLAFQKAMPRSKTILSMPSPPPRTKSQIGDHLGAGQPGDSGDMTRATRQKEGNELAKRIEGALGTSPDLKNLLKNIDFEITKEGIRIELVESTGSVFFESGSATIRPLAIRVIRKIAPILRATGRPMIVEGHTDAKPYAGEMYNNWDLSTLRALSLRRELAAAGFGAHRFVSVRGMADTELKDPAHPFDFRNRRVSLLLPWTKAPSQVVGEKPKDAIKKGVQAEFNSSLHAMPAGIDIAPRGGGEDEGTDGPSLPLGLAGSAAKSRSKPTHGGHESAAPKRPPAHPPKKVGHAAPAHGASADDAVESPDAKSQAKPAHPVGHGH